MINFCHLLILKILLFHAAKSTKALEGGMEATEEFNLAGPCGIFCGLCTKYQSKAPSRCLGCRLGEQHSWCSFYRE